MLRQGSWTSEPDSSPDLASEWGSLHSEEARLSSFLEFPDSRDFFRNSPDLQPPVKQSPPSRCRIPICTSEDCRLPTHCSYRGPMTSFRRSPFPSRCMVPLCNLDDCQLISHSYYSEPRNLLLNPRHMSSPLSCAQDSASVVHTKKLLGNRKPSRFKILSDRVEGLSVLPIEDESLRQADILPEIMGLFNRFFCHHFDEITAIHYSPSSRSYALKHAALELALEEPVYCMSLIALSQFHETKDQNPDNFLEAPLTPLLYSRLLRYCCELLDDPDESYVDLLVFAIVVVCLFDLSTGREASLRIHRKGLVALLLKIGGHHNLSMSLPYALWIDRAIAIVLLEKPLFPSPNPPMDALDSPVDRLYGLEFERSRLMSTTSSEIAVVCKDAARLMDMFEARRTLHNPSVSPEPDKSLPAPSIDHFFFLRDNVDFRLSSLLVHRDEFNLLEDCALLATKIVEDTVAFANCLPALNLCLSVYIWERLRTAANGGIDPGGKVTWGRFNDVLLWILFACAIPCTLSSEHQGWVEKMISKVAKSLFGKRVLWQNTLGPGKQKIGKDRAADSADIWIVLSRFVWSSSLTARFDEICSRIPD